MKTRSAKAKGKRLQNLICEKLRTKFCYDGSILVKEDINSTIMGESGRDVKLSPAAEKLIPFDIECKNVETLKLYDAVKQSESNTKDSRIPLVIFHRNRTKVYACLRLDLYQTFDSSIEIPSETPINNKSNFWVYESRFKDSTYMFRFFEESPIYIIIPVDDLFSKL